LRNQSQCSVDETTPKNVGNSDDLPQQLPMDWVVGCDDGLNYSAAAGKLPVLQEIFATSLNGRVNY